MLYNALSNLRKALSDLRGNMPLIKSYVNSRYGNEMLEPRIPVRHGLIGSQIHQCWQRGIFNQRYKLKGMSVSDNITALWNSAMRWPGCFLYATHLYVCIFITKQLNALRIACSPVFTHFPTAEFSHKHVYIYGSLSVCAFNRECVNIDMKSNFYCTCAWSDEQY